MQRKSLLIMGDGEGGIYSEYHGKYHPAPSIVTAILPFWDFFSWNEFWIDESFYISNNILHDWNSHSNFISSLQDLQE